MSGFKHILFPVDFSERCNGAVPFVESMARRFGAKVTLLSVAHPHYAGGIAGAPVIDPQAILQHVKSQIDGAFEKEFSGLTVGRVAELGDPAHVIADFVKANGVDLVMMPSHGYGPFRQLLLGSVTAKVLHDVDCAVWTTAHTGEAPEPEHLQIAKVLCAVDGSPQSISVMQRAAAIAKDLNASLRLIHVVPGIEAWPERQMDIEFEEQIRANAKQTIEELQKSAGVDAPLCVAVGAVADGVAEEAERHEADLLITGRGALHGTLGRLRTHAHGIIRLSPCPVISL
jgi:nucleotide-binding universal stress UspA family protein